MKEEVASTGQNVAVLSHWQLIFQRFIRHRLAGFSFFVLFLLYFLSVFAEFFAPDGRNHRDHRFCYAPPQVPGFSLEEGFYVNRLMKRVDPVTFAVYYIEDTNVRVPLGFFVRGDSYSFYGLFEWDVHFFGIDHERDRISIGEKNVPAGDARKVEQICRCCLLTASAEHSAVPPYVHSLSASSFFLLGADDYGRDLFSRILYGARLSLFIGFFSVGITFCIGAVLGGLSGYSGGMVDVVIQRLIEILNSFPHLPLWLALAAAVPRDWDPVMVYLAISVLLSLLNWTGLARIIRGKLLSLREEDYAVDARLLGASHTRIIFRHLLPGFTSHIIVSVTLTVPQMILGETALSFLGLGLKPPVVSWGVLLQKCINMEIVVNYPWMMTPAVFIIITVLAFNFVGDGIRDAADPYSSGH